MELNLIEGTVEDLHIRPGSEVFVQTDSDRIAGGGAAVALAMAGLEGAASGALLATSDAADSVEFFNCRIGKIRASGRFSKVTFKNGDVLQFSGQLQDNNLFNAFSARDVASQTIWMLPHCSRGRKVHWRRTFKLMIGCSLAMAVLFSAIYIAMTFQDIETLKDERLWFGVVIAISTSVFLGCFLPLSIAWRWRRFVAVAENVFETYGYESPTHVDLQHEDRLYWREKGVQNPKPFDAGGPWIYKYPSTKS